MKTNNEIILETIKGLDISETMHKNAEEKYKNVARYLESKGIEAEIYPQGSFRQGTVVRPYRKGKDSNYDLDFVCKCYFTKEECDPGDLKQAIGDALKEDKTYRDRLVEYDRCWTLEYADIVDGIGFNIDIVPAIKEDDEFICWLLGNGIEMDKAMEAIAITEAEDEASNWISTNPEGFAKWFEDINRLVYEDYIYEEKYSIYRRNIEIYSSIEEVPDYRVKTPLQRAIQVLKRHRDIYYYRSNIWDYRPISAIITTLLSYIAKENVTINNTMELLNETFKEIRGLDSYIRNNKVEIDSVIMDKVKRLDDDRWEIINPVNPQDNLADCWTDKTAKLFLSWIKQVEKDLLVESEYSDKLIRSSLGVTLRDNTINLDIEPTQPWSDDIGKKQ